jgi:hypothetical protein
MVTDLSILLILDIHPTTAKIVFFFRFLILIEIRIFEIVFFPYNTYYVKACFIDI